MAVTLDRKARHAEAAADKRATGRDLTIPEPEDISRRERLGQDDAAWLQFYLSDVFYNPFTDDQLDTIDQCGRTLKYGMKKCKAAPRGDGKSSIVKYLALKYALYRQLRFPLVVAATHTKARGITGSLKKRLAAKKSTRLSADFPLECHTARYVDPWPSRARNVTANGLRSIHVEWGADYFILPTWADNEMGSIVMALGYTSDDLQGCNVLDIRPDFVMLDDLDSRDSLASEDGKIAAKIEEVVDKTVAGLGGQSRGLGQYMICTITSREAAAYKYSDLEQKPAWDGERVSAIKEWPDGSLKEGDELPAIIGHWGTYIEKRQNGMQRPENKDLFGREAHQYYLDNREAMDAGAVLSNPNNFESDELPDGTQKQVSALQRCMDFIADHGIYAFLTDYQNDPPKSDDAMQTVLTPYHVANNCTGVMERLEVDSSAKMVVAGVDVRKIELHWLSLASDDVRRSLICDYNTRAHGGTETTVEQSETLIRDALDRLAERLAEGPVDENGIVHPHDLVLIDKGWMGSWKDEDGEVKTWVTQPVEEFCIAAGLRRFIPAHGISRYVTPEFKPKQNTIGDNWHMNLGRGSKRRCTEIIWSKPHWTQKVEELFLMQSDSPDAFEMFAPPNEAPWTRHTSFANHIECGLKDYYEKYHDAPKPKAAEKRRRKDHWFDSLVMALVARSVETQLRERDSNKKQPMTLAQMAGRR